MASLTKSEIVSLLARALDRRAAISEGTTAYRWVDDAADGLPGIAIDRYDAWAVLSIFDGSSVGFAENCAEASLGFVRGVYVKHRPRADLRRVDRAALAPRKPWGEPAPEKNLVVRAGPLAFRVALDDGFSTGLFNDQRENRVRVGEFASGARVLNLFSYTCAFTVAAALGGAKETVSVDSSKRALGRGRENLELNGASGPAHRLLAADAFDWVARAGRSKERFDLVVLDPPSFGTRQKKTFSADRDYEGLASSCLSLLRPDGRLLAVTNHQKSTTDGFTRVLRNAARTARRDVKELRVLPTPLDHPHRVAGEPRMKSALVAVR